MKKNFSIQQANKNPDRAVDAIKYEIRKYLRRERGKVLPEGAAFWVFDCRFGPSSEEAEVLKASEINSALDKAKEAKWEGCYIEILARAASKKPQGDKARDEDCQEKA